MARPLIDRLTLDSVNLKVLSENRLKTSGFSQFRAGFLSQLWNNVKTNWLMLIFCLPVVAWVIFSRMAQISADSSIPYSGNIGIGYPIINDAHIVGATVNFELAMRRALIMLPLIIIASAGLAGVFNVAKYLVWGFQIKILKTFFRGVKNSFAPFIWVGMMLGICFLLINLAIFGFEVASTPLIWRIFAYIGIGILSFFVLLISLFITTQSAVFNLSLFEILKNSLHLGIRFILQNSLILVVGLVSMALPLLTFNSYVTIAANMAFFFAAFSWTACAWTVYTHYLFEMIYENIEAQPIVELKAESGGNAPQGVKTEKAAASAGKGGGKPAGKYHNPKKKKKNG